MFSRHHLPLLALLISLGIAWSPIRAESSFDHVFRNHAATMLLIDPNIGAIRDTNDPFWHYQSGLEAKVDLQSSQIQQYIAQIRSQDRRTIIVLFASLVGWLF